MRSVLLIGLGLFGQKIALELNKLNHEVMAVDTDEEKVNRVLPYVTDAQIGDTTDENFLRSLGVSDYDVCFVTIGDDFQSSLETTSLLKDLGARRVVARASDDVHRKFLLRNGADEVVYPEKFMAKWTAIRFSSANVKDYIPVPGDYSIFEVEVPSSWVGKSMIELKIRQNMRLNVLAVKNTKDDFNMDYDPSAPFKAGQTVVIIGSDADLRKHLGLSY